MKNRIIIFLVATLLSLLVIPTINIFFAPNREAIKWRDKSFLYNMDFAERWFARFLYPIGVSIDPKQVIIGHDNWLYLGDMYEQTRSVTRRSPTLSDVELGKQIGAATEAWNRYLSSKGVQLFRIMIVPNKGAIYPEYMPDWAKPASPGVTDALIKGTDTTNYIDLRGPLLAAKKIYPEALYYKTDTHWNDLGAGIGFRFFAQQVAALIPELQWPSESAYSVVRVDPRQGGDLANFLRLCGTLTDSQPIIRNVDFSVETTQYDFDTMQVVRQGGNSKILAPTKPLLIRSEGALNKKKVLWLRDSFGTAMSPLMAATFTEVLQLHWSEAIKPGGRLLQMVEDWKPDYVFLTVAERSARASQFVSYPPPVIINMDDRFRAP